MVKGEGEGSGEGGVGDAGCGENRVARIPTGFRLSAQGWRQRRQPWVTCPPESNPNGVVSLFVIRAPIRTQPRWGRWLARLISQGRRGAPTLGFVTKPRCGLTVNIVMGTSRNHDQDPFFYFTVKVICLLSLAVSDCTMLFTV